MSGAMYKVSSLNDFQALICTAVQTVRGLTAWFLYFRRRLSLHPTVCRPNKPS